MATVQFTGIQNAPASLTDLKGAISDKKTGKLIANVENISLTNGSTNVINLDGYVVFNGQSLQLSIVNYTGSEDVETDYSITAFGSAVVTSPPIEFVRGVNSGDYINIKTQIISAGYTLNLRIAHASISTADYAVLRFGTTNPSVTVKNALLASRAIEINDGVSAQTLPLGENYLHGKLQTWSFSVATGNVLTVSLDGVEIGDLTIAADFKFSRVFDGDGTGYFAEISYIAPEGLIYRVTGPERSSKSTTFPTYNLIDDSIASHSRFASGDEKMQLSGDYLESIYPVDSYTKLSVRSEPGMTTAPDGNYTLFIVTGQSLGSAVYGSGYSSPSAFTPKNSFVESSGSLVNFYGSRGFPEISLMDEYAKVTGENLLRINAAVSGSSLAEIKSGTGNFANLEASIDAITAALSGSQSVTKVVIVHVHGESDSTTNAFSYYATDLAQYQADIMAKCNTAFGATLPHKMLISQTGAESSNSNPIVGRLAINYVMLSLDNPTENRYVCAPRFHLNAKHPNLYTSDVVHLSPRGYERMGLDFAMALIDAENNNHDVFEMDSATFTGSSCTVSFRGFAGDIRIDEFFFDLKSLGFMFERENGEFYLPTNATLNANNTVTLTSSEVLTTEHSVISADYLSSVVKTPQSPLYDSRYYQLQTKGQKISRRLNVSKLALVGA